MKNKGYFLPISIVIAAVLIAGSVIWSTGKKTAPEVSPEEDVVSQAEGPADLAPPVSKDDHVRGTAGAPITIIEYTDFECPFCKDFHMTMNQLLEEYEGEILWAVRHYPIAGLHSKAPKEAEAAECAAELGGNDAFWAFSDKVFEITPSNNGLDLNLLPQIAEDIGLDKAAFEECLDNGDTADLIDEDLADIDLLEEYSYRTTGQGIGTPYSIIINEEGKSASIPGAYPYEQMRVIIEQILAS